MKAARDRLLAALALACGIAVVLAIYRANPSEPSINGGDLPLAATSEAAAFARIELPEADADADGELAAPEAASKRSVPAPTGAIAASHTHRVDATVVVSVVSRIDATPVAGVRVSVYDRGATLGMLAESAPTDAKGRTTIAVPSGTDLVLFAKKRVPTASTAARDVAALSAGDRHECVLTVDPGDTVRVYGQVVACDGRGPIAGATVRLCIARGGTLDDGEPRESEVVGAAESDANGMFALDYPRARNHYLWVKAAGFGPVVFEVERERNTPGDRQVICLERAARLSVDVRELLAHAKAQAKVRVMSYSTSAGMITSSKTPMTAPTPDLVWTATTDARGIAEFTEIPALMRLQVGVLSGDKRPRPNAQYTILKPADAHALRFSHQVRRTIRGRVVDRNGEPFSTRVALLETIERMHVDVNSTLRLRQSTSADANGRFEFADVLPGRWSVAPRGPESEGATKPLEAEFTAAPVHVIVESGEDPAEVTLQVHRALFIEGHVFDPWGAPARVASITAHEASDRCTVKVSVRSGGSFRVGPLIPGDYTIVASVHAGQWARSAEQRAVAGDAGLELRMRALRTLRGRIVDERIGDSHSAKVSITSTDAPAVEIKSTSTRSEGAFNLLGLEPGVYDLRASTSDGWFGDLPAVALGPDEDVEDLTIRLRLGAKLRLRCDGPEDGGTFQILVGAHVVETGSLRRGVELACFVPEGALTLRFSPADGGVAQTQTVLVTSGERRSIVFTEAR